MRTGNPWVNGRVSPFIETASIASRPSIATDVGVPTVKPSTERVTIWSASGCTPASSSSGFSGTPIHRAFPMYGPPTSFDTHASVMSRSMTSRDINCSNVSSISRSTMPWIVRRHVSVSTRGTMNAVSTR